MATQKTTKTTTDVNITVKDGKSVLLSLIEAIRANTEALERLSGNDFIPIDTEDTPQATPPAPVTSQTAATTTPPAQAAPQRQDVPPWETAVQPNPAVPAMHSQPQRVYPAVTYAAQQVSPQGSRPAQPQQAGQAVGPAPQQVGHPNFIPDAVAPQNYPQGAAAPSAPSAPVNSAASGVTLDQIARAGADLVDRGFKQQVLDLLGRMGVNTVMDLRPEQYESMAQGLRALGAAL